MDNQTALPTAGRPRRVALLVLLPAALTVGTLAFLHRPPLDAVAALWGAASQDAAAAPPPAPVVVTVEPARAEDVPLYLSGIGTVQAFNTVKVKTQVDGKIAQVLFTEGQDVKVGNPLVLIDPRPYQATLQQQTAARARDAAALRDAKLDLDRYADLVKKGAATQQQVDHQQALVDQDEGSVQNDEAQMDYARTQLGFTTITSPIDGRVGIRQVDVGNFVRAGDGTTLVVITQLQPISAVFTLPADAVAQQPRARYRPRARHRARPRRHHRARPRHRRPRGQPGRPGDRHAQAEGELPQRRAEAVARQFCQRPAALKGARQIGFTVVSLTVSLVAVFIPLLLMGGVVGLLLREFAVTLSLAVVISGAVSLTLTP